MQRPWRNDLGACPRSAGPTSPARPPAAVTPAGAAPPCPRSAAAMSPARPPAAATPAGRSSTFNDLRACPRSAGPTSPARPASRSDTRRRSSTLPEVRCSDVSGPPASRSYTRWPQLHLARSPLQRERCVEKGSLEAAAKRQKFWFETSICTSSLWIEFAFGFCTMTLVHF